MTRDEIIKLARDAGFVVDEKAQQHQPNCIFHTHHMVDELLERFAVLVAEAEREACAWVCINEANVCELSSLISDQDKVSCLRSTAFRLSVCADAIRARQSNG